MTMVQYETIRTQEKIADRLIEVYEEAEDFLNWLDENNASEKDINEARSTCDVLRYEIARLTASYVLKIQKESAE